jgi:hypothetical protein
MSFQSWLVIALSPHPHVFWLFFTFMACAHKKTANKPLPDQFPTHQDKCFPTFRTQYADPFGYPDPFERERQWWLHPIQKEKVPRRAIYTPQSGRQEGTPPPSLTYLGSQEHVIEGMGRISQGNAKLGALLVL